MCSDFLATPRIADRGESIFDNEYLREFDAEIEKAFTTYMPNQLYKKFKNQSYCHAPLKGSKYSITTDKIPKKPIKVFYVHLLTCLFFT
jgi:hypothetical protein